MRREVCVPRRFVRSRVIVPVRPSCLNLVYSGHLVNLDNFALQAASGDTIVTNYESALRLCSLLHRRGECCCTLAACIKIENESPFHHGGDEDCQLYSERPISLTSIVAGRKPTTAKRCDYELIPAL